MRRPIVTLSAADCGRAIRVGYARRMLAIKLGRRHTNGYRPTPAQALANDIMGVRAEIAVWRWLEPISWHALADDVEGLPDLGDDINVKGVGQTEHRLLLPPKPRRDWQYVLARGHDHPTWVIAGWIPGEVAADMKVKPLGNPPRLALIVENEELPRWPLEELWEHVERKYPAERN